MNENKRADALDSARSYELGVMADYAESSIVSRILFKNSAGNITLFSFDEGQSLSEHATPYDALVQVLDGEVDLTIGGKSVIAGEGEIVIMPAGVPHAVFARRRFKMLLTMLKGR